MDFPHWGDPSDTWKLAFIASTASSMLGLQKLRELKIRICTSSRYHAVTMPGQSSPTVNTCLAACVQELRSLPFITVVHCSQFTVNTEAGKGFLKSIFNVLDEQNLLRIEEGNEYDLWAVDPDAYRHFLYWNAYML